MKVLKVKAALAFIFILYSLTIAGTTGKITGRVVNKETKEPLIGVNVILKGTDMGAATDINGNYVILNVPPGKYTVKSSMIGFISVEVKDVRVTIDLTSTVNFELTPTVLEIGEPISVVGERPIVQMDLTSSAVAISSEQIAEMPVEEFSEILELQAGVIKGSSGELYIRGGRSTEIAYLIDGIPVTDPFSGDISVEVENTAIQELRLVSGTFNAEYGQAMSGIVEIVTKDGDENYSGMFTAYFGDYYSSNKDIFMNIDDVSLSSIQNYQLFLTGPFPLLKDKLFFYTTGRFLSNEGWLYGLRRFIPKDSSNFDAADPSDWYIEQTGDMKYVPMNPYRKFSIQSKITLKATSYIKLSYNFLWDKIRFRTYDHLFKLNPDGDYERFRSGYTHMLAWNHTLTPRTFYTLKFSNNYSNYKYYVYEDPFYSLGYDSNPSDTRGYVHPRRLREAQQYAFYTGGTAMEHFYRTSITYLGRFDFTSQIHPIHQIKFGIEGKVYKMKLREFEIIPRKTDAGLEVYPFKPEIPPVISLKNNDYVHYPKEISAYIQDKIEYRDLILNLGLRYDYFNPDGVIPTDLRDPNNTKFYLVDNNGYLEMIEEIKFKGDRSEILDSLDILGNPWKYKYTGAKSKHQFSPRLGIAYPITDKGVIHFSYGHFFQIPPFEYLYINPEFEIAEEDLSVLMGNADLKPQQTVIYEVGLQQQFGETIGMDVTGFYKDIRNLLGTEINKLYSGIKYGRYTNRDYGNVRGISVSFEKRRTRYLSAHIDYTYQIAEGNASDPNAVFQDARSKPPLESEIQVVPLNWDQRHTLNLTLTVSDPGNWGVSFIGKMGSGLPYTPAYRNIRTTFENSGRKKPTYTFDLKCYKDIDFSGLNLSVFLKVYNLIDRKNELIVYSDTGRSGYTLSSKYAFSVQGVNTVEEYFKRPDFYSEPRLVLIGMSVGF
ncbi:MAG: TonB-dependent receptor domain-containing protein [Fidelibacterota bacterium]